MNPKELVHQWFDLWAQGDFNNLPITNDFKHTSPFGAIDEKQKYIDLVANNKEKFWGYHFQIHDEIYANGKACVRYTAIQGDFKFDVSEWYYFQGNQISEIVAYYHIGEIREDRRLS